MIEQIIDEFAEYNRKAREEDDYLLKLQTEAEGVGSIKYGDDTSHGTQAGDHLENATIRLAEAKKRIAKKRAPRFEAAAEVEGWLYDRLKPEPAKIMTMYVVDNLTYREIAHRTGKSIGWVVNEVKKSGKNLK